MRASILAARAAVLIAAGVSIASGQHTIRQIDLITLSHTDVGYTDQPSVARELHKKFLDIALDACLRTAKLPPAQRYYWTTESQLAVFDWWKSAPEERRRLFLEMVRAGQIAVGALSCNNTPFMNAEEWHTATHWLPDSVWKQVQPDFAVQSDVNGMPRAGAMKLLDRGVHRLLMGINIDSGGRAFPAPAAFWWKMPDGRKMFVWQGEHYGIAYNYFEPKGWIGGNSRVGNTASRPPRPGEFLRSDEASVRAAHKYCLEKLAALESGGYKLPRLLMSLTNQWRWDNDTPFPPIVEFVATWNRLKLEPVLRLTTGAVALRDMEQEVGAQVPVYEGEWTDWWANGDASAPREVAASRLAKRYLRAARSETWGPVDAGTEARADEILRDLVLFDEHTWGSAYSISRPWSLDAQAQFAEKAMLAYRPMAYAEWLLGARMHLRLDKQPGGIYVANPGTKPASGWVRFPRRSPRREFQSLEDAATGRAVPVEFENADESLLVSQAPAPVDVKTEGAPVARFWVENLAPGAILRLTLSDRKAPAEAAGERPSVETGEKGWPTAIRWKGMKQPLFLSGFGDFLAVEVDGSRSLVASLAAGSGTEKDQAEGRKHLREVPARATAETEVEMTPHTTVYRQRLEHPRLRYLIRTLEVWNDEPRVRLTLRLYRESSEKPEAFYANFRFPAEGVFPVISSGGVPFVPFREQLGATCRDYLALDGWAQYKTADAGEWLWVTRDAAMVTVGGPNTLARLKEPAGEPSRLMAMLFNNFWHTNFVADQHGAMDFQFDLVWREKIDNPDALADILMTDPLVLVNPPERADPVFDHLWKP